jgi:hypothetical protein
MGLEVTTELNNNFSQLVDDAKLGFASVILKFFGKGVFYVIFTDSITGKDSDNLVLLSGLCVGEISFRVLLGYTSDDCDG